MAKNDNKTQKRRNTSVFNNLTSYVQGSIDSLYKNTYFNQPTNVKDLDIVKKNIDNSIDEIINNNVNSVGIPNISRLYSRIHMKNNSANFEDKKVIDEIENLFNDRSLADGLLLSYTENKYLKDLDEEIDIICKYMPQLDDALDAKKDNVLSADHFSKDFVNVINKSNVKEETSFNERINLLKQQYNLIELFEDMYDNTARYGEQFVYVVPYEKALNVLTAAKNGTSFSAMVANNEAAELVSEGLITAKFDMKEKKFLVEGCKDIKPLEITENMAPIGDLKVELHASSILESAVNQYKSIQRVTRNVSRLYEQRMEKTVR
jgi:hypothetical protein